MKIAVNTRLLIRNKLEGIGWFTFESLKRITFQHPEHHFYFIFDRAFDPEFIFSGNITPIILSPQARHPFLFHIWFEYSLPPVLDRIKPDIFLSPDGYLSLKSKVRSLAVIHDLNFEHYPEDLPYWVRKYYRHYFPKFALKADRIATVSEFSKQDIIAQYGIQADKIDVVYDGSNERYKPLREDEKIDIRNKYSGGFPYFLFIGSLHPRKNLINLFRAFDLFRDQDSSGTKLIIAGAKQWWTRDIKNAFARMKFMKDVIFYGHMNIGELSGLLGAALAMTYVSYFEGFGIPIIEAFRCETPVITASVTSMPEVAGDAALLVDPFNPEAIAEAMTQLSRNESLRKRLIQRGINRKNTFSWDRTAGLLWKSIEKTIQPTI